jgi:hypothetical protein
VNSAKFKQKRTKSVKTWHRKKQTTPEKIKLNRLNDRMCGCSGKRRFPDLTSAFASGSFVAEIGDTKEIYIYKCRHCRGYHLTGEMFSPHGEENHWVFDYEKGVE